MAELYSNVPVGIPGAVQQQPSVADARTGNAEIDDYLKSIPPEDRQAAFDRINAPLTGEELARQVEQGYTPTIDEFDKIKQWHSTHEVEILSTMGNAFSAVADDISNAVGAVWDKPGEATVKLPANVAEGFAQGTRNFYGMIAKSQDPSSALFRLKDLLNNSGTKEEQYAQYLDALKFNRQSAALASGKETLVMDKDLINPEVVQAMSYVADPTLFIPFGSVAKGGLKAVGLGEKMMMAGARAAATKQAVLGGVLKWGVGAPIEFLGGAVRNTIDWGVEKGAGVVGAASGMAVDDIKGVARASASISVAAGMTGTTIPYVHGAATTYVGATAARGFGEAITAVGDAMMRNAEFGRGINSWAKEALEQSGKNGIELSRHAKQLLGVLDAVDPMFAYGDAITAGAAHGTVIGAGLGYIGGGEEGAAAGAGAGMALGAVGGAAGKVAADASGQTLYGRVGVQAKMVIEGLKETNPTKAEVFQFIQKYAESAGDARFLGEINGIIAGLDKIAPDVDFFGYTPESYAKFLEDRKIDPNTGRLYNKYSIFGELPDRKSSVATLALLRENGSKFQGDSAGFKKAYESGKLSKTITDTFGSLSSAQKEAFLKQIDLSGTPEFRKQLGAKSLGEYYANLHYAESLAKAANDKAATAGEGAARSDIQGFLKQETRNGKLTQRGNMLVEKLKADGWMDKDGNILSQRNTDAQATIHEFVANEGFVLRRNSNGRVEVHLNYDGLTDRTVPHEMFHAVFRQSALSPDFIDRLTKELIGTYDAKGILLKKGSVDPEEARAFFKKYAELTVPESKLKDEHALIDRAIDEWKSSGNSKAIADSTLPLLHHYAEEFGAYYFQEWMKGQPVDYLFKGGELGGIRGIIESAKDGWKDWWAGKMGEANPSFDFSKGIDRAFFDGKRKAVTAFDFFMRDWVKANAASVRGSFDITKLSPAGQDYYIRNNGLRNLYQPSKLKGNRGMQVGKADAQNAIVGKQVFKILNSIDPAVRGTKTVKIGNETIISGRLSDVEMDAIVKSGMVDRAWVDKIRMAYAILDGNGSNSVQFGYHGRSMGVSRTDDTRVYGNDVAFKHRRAILLNVDFRVSDKGKFYAMFETLDKAVIEGRQNDLWKDPAVRALWGGDRARMDADFFRYLEHASTPNEKRPAIDSAQLLDGGDGKGKARRDALHQMLGMSNETGDPYINKPIAEIPKSMIQSVTTFSNDGISNFRTEDGKRYNYNHDNAYKLLARNWKPAEMNVEETAQGRIFTHASDFKFVEGVDGKVHAYDRLGRRIGSFGSLDEAAQAGEKNFNQLYDNFDKGVAAMKQEQESMSRNFKPVEEAERKQALELGDVFKTDQMREFVGDRLLLRQTREEFIRQRTDEILSDDSVFDYVVSRKFYELSNSGTTSAEENSFLGVYIDSRPAPSADEARRYIKARAGDRLGRALFGRDYDNQIRIGKPFVAVATHGTGSSDLVLGRLFKAEYLGSNYDIPSSRLGSFHAGSTETSSSYEKSFKKFSLPEHEKEYRKIISDIEHFDGFSMRRIDDVFNKDGEKDVKVSDAVEDIFGTISNAAVYFQFAPIKKGVEYSILELDKASIKISKIKNNFATHDSEREYVSKLESEVDSIRNRAFVLKEAFGSPRTVQGHLRTVVRMDNPMVIVDPRSYEEHYISPHMKRAVDAGHDGIVFKNFADGGPPDNVYVVFKDFIAHNIRVLETTLDEQNLPRGTDTYGNPIKGGRELGLSFKPVEEGGGRQYDQNSKEWKSGFIGKWAEDNREKLAGKNIQFVKKGDGSLRVAMSDNSIKGQTQDVGHISAHIKSGGKVAQLNSNISEEFRGNGLSYALYSEMAERLRALGIEKVTGEVINEDGVPVKVRERIIGDTRSESTGKPIGMQEASAIVKGNKAYNEKRGIANYGSVKVYNKLNPEARYKAVEPGWRDWKSETTATGAIIKNSMGYALVKLNDNFRVYNPYKALIGVYSDLEQAKKRVQREEPKR